MSTLLIPTHPEPLNDEIQSARTILTATSPGPRTIRIGATRYPVFLPNVRDSRLHVAAVVLTIHALGQTVLDFRVSVVQIFAAIITCFTIEVAVVFGREKAFRWPASAMLTGSGVGLIMRLPDMSANSPWSTTRWWMYSAVAGGSLVTKYVIRDRGRHVFNPSNVGLVFVFLVLGSHFAEPLDFWWAPINPWMVGAYALIIAGGTFVTRRVGLLPMAATFWVTLAAGLAAVAISGHSIYSPFSLHPVSGWHFWWLVMTSPETLIFVYFMLSDPKTVPQRPVDKVVFGFAVAMIAVLLIAPQKTEYATKVALLGALTICSVLRSIVHRRNMPVVRASVRPRSLALGGVTLASVLSVAIVLVGARSLGETVDAAQLPAATPLATSTDGLPTVAVSPEAFAFDPAAAAEPQALAAQLLHILATERTALLTKNPALLGSVSYGRRLAELRDQSDLAGGQDSRIASAYTFTSLRLVLLPSRSEGANRLGFDAEGTVSESEFALDGPTIEVNPRPFHRYFVLRRATDRWLLVDELNQETQTRTSLQ